MADCPAAGQPAALPKPHLRVLTVDSGAGRDARAPRSARKAPLPPFGVGQAVCYLGELRGPQRRPQSTDGGSLHPHRAAPRTDVAAVEQTLLRISPLMEAHHEIADLECNSIVVSPEGAVAIDVRARVEVVSELLRSPRSGRSGEPHEGSAEADIRCVDVSNPATRPPPRGQTRRRRLRWNRAALRRRLVRTADGYRSSPGQSASSGPVR